MFPQNAISSLDSGRLGRAVDFQDGLSLSRPLTEMDRRYNPFGRSVVPILEVRLRRLMNI
jgi:hypothetical protein